MTDDARPKRSAVIRPGPGRLTNWAKDNYVGQEISQLTECRMSDLSGDFPGWRSWLTGFVLSTLAVVRVPDEDRRFLAAVLRRAQAAFEDYEDARQALLTFLAVDNGVSSYFRCLRRLEDTVAMLYQTLDVLRRHRVVKGEVSPTWFAPNDGSMYQRLNSIYNESRHAGALLDLPEGHLHVVWLRNDGIHSQKACLTFDELHGLMCDVGTMADDLSNLRPTSPAEPSPDIE